MSTRRNDFDTSSERYERGRVQGRRHSTKEPAGVSFHTVIQAGSNVVVNLVPVVQSGLTVRIDGIHLWADSGTLWILQYMQNMSVVAQVSIQPLVAGGHTHIEGPFYLHGIGVDAEEYTLDLILFGTTTCGLATAYGVQY